PPAGQARPLHALHFDQPASAHDVAATVSGLVQVARELLAEIVGQQGADFALACLAFPAGSCAAHAMSSAIRRQSAPWSWVPIHRASGHGDRRAALAETLRTSPVRYVR